MFSRSSCSMTASDSSSVKPPRWKSAELSLIARILSGPIAARTARVTSSRNRQRRSGSPPQSSSRRVGKRGEELIDEVTVGGVDLNAVEAGLHDGPRGPCEARDQIDDLLGGQGARLGERGAHVELDGAGGDGHFGKAGKGLATGMIDLDQRGGAVALGGCRCSWRLPPNVAAVRRRGRLRRRR